MNIQNLPWRKTAVLRIDKTRRVMIVDDHEIFRNGLRSLLAESEAFRVVAEASNCEDALIHLQSLPIDLVLLDLHLPDVNGMEALHRLKKNSPSPDVIIISATIDDDTLLDALLADISGYLTKDTSAIEILDALHTYQDGEMAFSFPVASRAIHLLLQHCNILEGELAVYRRNGMNTFTEIVAEPALPFVIPTAQIARNPLPVLTPQEERVYQGMCKGQSNKQIAAELYISRFTVGKHVQNILRKLGVTNRTQAVSYTLFEGDIEM
jgi:DNA-binding NarL/FixJ family response regulator